MIIEFQKYCKVIIISTLALLVVGCANQKEYSNLRLNEIQIIGSHNSYKIAIEKELWNIIFQKDSSLAYSLQYEHPSISEQLNLGLRNLEIDLFYDPKGGKYSHPHGLELLKSLNNEVISFDESGELKTPGLKIFHIQDIDFRSHNLLFKNCLEELKKWSEHNSGHLPVIITVNAKDHIINEPNIRVSLPFTKNALDSIDIEIKSVFAESKLITPKLIQGKFSTLEEAVLKNGWPIIDTIRGRFLFVLDETGAKLKNYLNPDSNLIDKVMFINSEEGNPTAAFRIINDPEKNEDYIKSLVKKGYMVRTRADADTREAREDNYSRFEKAISSGAQVITTDYYLPSKLFKSNYKIIFGNGKYVKINSQLVSGSE
ncbi:MAG: phosphatidylinositol-specific phospholipase C1-like protein [Bacteroidetes bacterium]|nr:phosphatidylinositol-specific phospholipase C1-like protein [Bacteroidota bacterium]MBU1116940.1 phosphatidylinositol-specific phospholipase C1-like protein [Bacteroidota bacterium]MBU1799113.1 phosphatidylinositol-specific phospholipase C1-like protein [Bacteroidota bacterium]